MRNLQWPSGKTLWLQKRKQPSSSSSSSSSASSSSSNDYIVMTYQNKDAESIIERGILLSNTMITDHLIGNYENAIWETLVE